MTVKYDFNLDLTSKNSLSLIIKKIRPGSTILEFGPAAGRMTRYLKEELDCKIYIVEIDEDAAEKASIYAEDKVVGNIEDFLWFEQFKYVKFDYIIFADVLEHLYNPQHVMSKCVELLGVDGSVIISVPNIAHNSVIIDLLHNKFEYRKTGLLDDTHVRFFTYTSLVKMVYSCNLAVIWEDAIIKHVGDTELGNFFDGLPKGVTKFLKNRPLGDLYQFVMELRPQQEGLNKRSNIVTKGKYYYSQLYVDCGNSFVEEQSLRITANGNDQICDFEMTGYSEINKLRFDPLNVNCIITIKSIVCVDKLGNESVIENYESNADFSNGNTFLFLHEDPQFYFDSPKVELNKITINLGYIDYEFDNIDWILGTTKELVALNSDYENKMRASEEGIAAQLIVNANMKLKIEDLEFTLQKNIDKNSEDTSVLLQKISNIESELNEELIKRQHKETELILVNEELNRKNKELAQIYSTTLGKVIARMIK
ncbi:class I SAM-dependent methyltransferase [Paenibacillus sp. BR2-3]|uniref:class I SAM-dependent methyltransferase n=1 Tax=Paenibacillus sp. BR2-3 TaxID=3048494 RepID=UPI003977C7FD